MDLADQAQDVELMSRELHIAQARKQGQSALQGNGRCHYCETLLQLPHRFCDADCRDDWQALQASKRRNGYWDEDDGQGF